MDTVLILHMYPYFMEHHENTKIDKEFLLAKISIEHVQFYYKELINFHLYIPSFYITNDEIYRVHKTIRKMV